MYEDEEYDFSSDDVGDYRLGAGGAGAIDQYGNPIQRPMSYPPRGPGGSKFGQYGGVSKFSGGVGGQIMGGIGPGVG